MYNFEVFWNSPRGYGSRWRNDNRKFSAPYYSIAKPLEQSEFVMTQLDENKQSFAVDMWGNPINPNEHGKCGFRTAQSLWLEGQGEYFDGYSIVLSGDPSPVYYNNKEYFLVAGLYENCITLTGNKYSLGGKSCTLSAEFMADRAALNYPLMWHTPDQKGMCWVGLSETPILGGATKTKKVSSFNLMLPITVFAAPDLPNEEDPFGENDYAMPLPLSADKIINKWFSKKSGE
jgi:hypothetical protein